MAPLSVRRIAEVKQCWLVIGHPSNNQTNKWTKNLLSRVPLASDGTLSCWADRVSQTNPHWARVLGVMACSPYV
jgi:hypothetical protein